jgi:hypothetical protein
MRFEAWDSRDEAPRTWRRMNLAVGQEKRTRFRRGVVREFLAGGKREKGMAAQPLVGSGHLPNFHIHTTVTVQRGLIDIVNHHGNSQHRLRPGVLKVCAGWQLSMNMLLMPRAMDLWI